MGLEDFFRFYPWLFSGCRRENMVYGFRMYVKRVLSSEDLVVFDRLLYEVLASRIVLFKDGLYFWNKNIVRSKDIW